ncbi:MAG: DUF302 domain-containing protein [Beijerinckiaceae bacterium]|nr:DUF302 domain-containing protein [Beijerinckiaceae bacterium]
MAEIVKLESAYTFEQTMQRLTAALSKNGFTIFAVIDQSAAARSVGLDLPPTTLIIYGNPRGGTPLMLAAPDFSIELPLRLVVRRDAGGAVYVIYQPASTLEGRHGLPPDMAAPLSKGEGLIAASVAATLNSSSI